MRKSLKIRSGDTGFTLMEMAICLLIIGVLLAGAAGAYRLYLTRQAQETTRTNVATIAAAIGNFRLLYGRYPCPGSLTAVRSDPAYGHESATDCMSAIYPPGVFFETSARNVTYTPTGNPPPATLNNIQPIVRIGAVPFRILNLQEDDAMDGYGNRIVYAVTEELANGNYFQPDGGGIDVVDKNGVTLLDVPSSAHFFVFSAGPDGAGAYSRAGTKVSNCPGTGPEGKNCAFGGPATFASAEVSVGNTVQKFDDVVSYFTQSDMPLWQYNANMKDIYEKPNGDVGTASNIDTTQPYKLQIPGSIHASGDLQVPQICDASNTTYCFPSNLIAGVSPTGGMSCPVGQYMTGIAHNAPVCATEVWATCPNGYVVQGIDANGGLVCSTPPHSCAATAENICGVSKTLSGATSGSSQTLSGGDSMSQTYVCSNGAWGQTASSGVCSCTAQSAQTQTVPCADGYTGSTYQTNTYSCPAGVWSGWVTTSSTCTCHPETETQTVSCQAGFNGQVTQQRSSTCVNGNAQWGSWTTTASTCACQTQTNTQTISCQAGYSGQITQTQTLQCPSGTWSGWTTTSNTCSCQSAVDTVYDSCPTGYVPNPHGITMQRTFECPAGSWTGYTQVADDCTLAQQQVCHWSPEGGGITGQSGPNSANLLGSSCSCGDISPCSQQVGSKYTNFTSCSCQ